MRRLRREIPRDGRHTSLLLSRALHHRGSQSAHASTQGPLPTRRPYRPLPSYARPPHGPSHGLAAAALCVAQVRDGEHYDTRVVDLWASGITLYLWCSGRLPFEGHATVMLLMKAIAEDDRPRVPAPAEASAGLASVIERLLTRDPAQRLTLQQLRHDTWLTDQGTQPMPVCVLSQVGAASWRPRGGARGGAVVLASSPLTRLPHSSPIMNRCSRWSRSK